MVAMEMAFRSEAAIVATQSQHLTHHLANHLANHLAYHLAYHLAPVEKTNLVLLLYKLKAYL